MKTLDRYIIRQFLINFTILLFVLMSLYVLVDMIVDLDEFVEAGVIRARQIEIEREAQRRGVSASSLELLFEREAGLRRGAQELGLTLPEADALAASLEPGPLAVVWGMLVKIAGYYGPMILLLYAFLSGLIVVAAMGFTVSAMQRTRELTAVMASGVSMYRVAAPIVVVGIALNALTLPLQEYLIPPLAPKLARSKSKIKYESIESFPVLFAADEQNHLLSAAEFDAARQRLRDLTILERDDRGLTVRRITASQGVWLEDADPPGWRLILGTAIRPEAELPPGTPAQQSLDFFPTELSPTVLLTRRAAIYQRLLSLRELQRMQANPAVAPADRASITQIIWGRFSMLVVNALVLVMGLPFFLIRGPVNLFVQAIKAAAVCLGAWGLGLTLLQVGGGTLNPVLAAWLPVVLYLPLSAALLQLIKT